MRLIYFFVAVFLLFLMVHTTLSTRIGRKKSNRKKVCSQPMRYTIIENNQLLWIFLSISSSLILEFRRHSSFGCNSFWPEHFSNELSMNMNSREKVNRNAIFGHEMRVMFCVESERPIRYDRIYLVSFQSFLFKWLLSTHLPKNVSFSLSLSLLFIVSHCHLDALSLQKFVIFVTMHQTKQKKNTHTIKFCHREQCPMKTGYFQIDYKKISDWISVLKFEC